MIPPVNRIQITIEQANATYNVNMPYQIFLESADPNNLMNIDSVKKVLLAVADYSSSLEVAANVSDLYIDDHTDMAATAAEGARKVSANALQHLQMISAITGISAHYY